jgi:hypothetical protein
LIILKLSGNTRAQKILAVTIEKCECWMYCILYCTVVKNPAVSESSNMDFLTVRTTYVGNAENKLETFS